MVWNEERVAILKKLWAEGLSASQVAVRLRGTTRNAVIAKIHRLGLAGRGSPLTRRKQNRSKRSNAGNGQKLKAAMNQSVRFGAAKPRPKSEALFRGLHIEAEPFATAEELDIPLKERRQLMDLSDKDCRWPIGDPQMADFHFCNRNKVPGLPYCEFHARRAFQPPQRRGVKEPSGTSLEPIAGPAKPEEVA